MVSKFKVGMYMEAIQWKAAQIRRRFGNSNQFDKMQKLSKPVLYTGNIFSDILIVGRDLGKEEVEQGQVFVGKSGGLVREGMKRLGYLEAADNPAWDYCMTNLVPYKPTGNKCFSLEIRQAFWPIVNYVVKVVEPDYLVTMGRECAEMFHGSPIRSILAFTRESGVVEKKLYRGTPFEKDITVISVPHPSYFIRRGGIDSSDAELFFLDPIREGLTHGKTRD